MGIVERHPWAIETSSPGFPEPQSRIVPVIPHIVKVGVPGQSEFWYVAGAGEHLYCQAPEADQ